MDTHRTMLWLQNEHPWALIIPTGLFVSGLIFTAFEVLVLAPHRRRERIMELAVEASANELEKTRIEAERAKLEASKASQKQ